MISWATDAALTPYFGLDRGLGRRRATTCLKQMCSEQTAADSPSGSERRPWGCWAAVKHGVGRPVAQLPEGNGRTHLSSVYRSQTIKAVPAGVAWAECL